MNIILASTSTLFEGNYLEYLKEEIQKLYDGIDNVLFIPYARPSGISYDEYTEIARQFFKTIKIEIKGIHEFENPKEAIQNTKAYFVGGGNTFLLVKTLHENGLMHILKENVEQGKPYLGCSAGSNIGGLNMKTTIRETRIKEFLTQNDIKVIGLREGNWIRRIGDEIRVEGTQLTRIFEKGKEPYEVESGHLL